MRLKFCLPILAWLLCLWIADGRAQAEQPVASIRGLLHEKWTAERGAPPGVQALARARDGFLWLGTDTGLFRFDGVRFEHMPTLKVEENNEGAVSALFAKPNGDLWIGYQSGRIALLRSGRLIDVSPKQSEVWIYQLLQAHDGTMWAVTGTKGAVLLRYSNGKWTDVDQKFGIGGRGTFSLALTPDGWIWLRDGQRILAISDDGKRAREAARLTAAMLTQEFALAVGTDGRLWTSSPLGGTRRFLERGEAAGPRKIIKSIRWRVPVTSTRRMIFDSAGNIWSASSNAGITYIGAPQGAQPTEERFTRADGLSTDNANVVLADSQGNVWVGTSAGLDRFRRPGIEQVTSIPARSPFGYGLFELSDGLYAIDSDSMYRIDRSGAARPILSGLLNPMAVCEDAVRSLWLVTYNGMFRRNGVKFGRAPEPAERSSVLDCVRTNDGRLWFNRTDGGLQHFNGREWVEGPFRDGGKPQLIGPMVAAPEGGMLAYARGKGLFHIDVLGVRLLSDLSEIPSGSITAFVRRGNTMLIAAPPYLARYNKGRLTVLRQSYPWLRGVSGMVEGLDGNLWLISRSGIVSVSLADLDRAFANPRHKLEPRIRGAEDGLPGSAVPFASHNGAGRSADGTLWFVTADSIVRVDPGQLVRNSRPAPVKITALAFADSIARDPSSAVLPAGTSRLEVNYTALDLADPTQLRFRYMLEGVDDDWIEADDRREASYTNLKPGSYRFHVIAANSDGVWNRRGATLDLEIRPTFFQSWPFRLMCVIIALILGSVAYMMRLRHVTERLSSRFEDRIAERERIARDLHDTLLQSFHGLVLHFQVAADRLARQQPALEAIDDALRRADRVLSESRDRVYELKTDFDRGDLTGTWSATAAALTLDSATRFSIVTEGEAVPLHPIVTDEVGLIGDEAIRNAYRHAGATQIGVVLTYNRRHLRLLVRDNGSGMPAALGQVPEVPGHFGLAGMRERARRVGGSLEIVTSEGSGTQVILSVRARAAYMRQRRWLSDFIGAVGPKG